MNTTILIPHYKEGRTTAYAIAQILKTKGKHNVNIIVVDNSPGDGSIKYVEPFANEITVLDYPTDLIQSHGVAYDYSMKQVNTDHVICFESDSFPTKEKWLDEYEAMALNGYDIVGANMKLSGGEFVHPAGTMYSRKLWESAFKYCQAIEYSYFPNMSVKEGFNCHLMVHNSILESFLSEPQDYIELASGYWKLTIQQINEKKAHYLPIAKGPFHNGMGRVNESIKTYGNRSIASEQQTVLLDNKQKLINRIGYEPGQWLTYFALASGFAVGIMPCEIKWMKDRENQQQEHTINKYGIKHIWCGSSYLSMKETEMNDVYEFKKKQVEDLYNSLPDHQKIKE